MRDRLSSRSEFDRDGPLALKEVEERFVRVSPVLNLGVAGQVLRTTGEHPFSVENRRAWLPARELAVGDLLRTRCDRMVAVESLQDSGKIETVYNWRIQDYHTYFVGREDWSFTVWAHNADGCGLYAPFAPRRLPAPGQVLNRNGVPYPTIIDPRTGQAVPFPSTIVRTPKASRVAWGAAERQAFIDEWRARGFADPPGGWGNYHIHHITPKELGGTNAFENLVPVERGVHQQTVTRWWNNFSGR